MDNLFRPNKWFVIYCGLFVVLWVVLQYVSNAGLKDYATQWGASVFGWQWDFPPGIVSSQAKNLEADVVSKNEHDAVVTIKGRQELNLIKGPGGRQGGAESEDISATLKFYRRSTGKGEIWELGEVQFP